MTAPTPPDDWEALLRAANAGDAGAYARFLTAITPVIRGLVRARAGGRLGREDCEDVVQTVLLAIHLKRDSWRPDAPVRPWLYAIARHKLIDALRARRPAAEPLDPLTDVLPAAAGPDLAARLDGQRLLARLPEREAAILRATALEGQTAAEAGARLSMTEGAVRVALHRALKRLARLRAETGHGG